MCCIKDYGIGMSSREISIIINEKVDLLKYREKKIMENKAIYKKGHVQNRMKRTI